MRARIEVPDFNPEAFEKARHDAGLTREQLGKLLNLSRHAVWTWESGRAPIPAAQLRRSARVLGCAVPDLQYPLCRPPTLADLRTRAAMTVRELAERSGIRQARLRLWETTGHLGTPVEEVNALRLASLLGIYSDLAQSYLRTGTLPISVAQPIASGLRTTAPVVQQAFAESRRAAGRLHSVQEDMAS